MTMLLFWGRTGNYTSRPAYFGGCQSLKHHETPISFDLTSSTLRRRSWLRFQFCSYPGFIPGSDRLDLEQSVLDLGVPGVDEASQPAEVTGLDDAEEPGGEARIGINFA